MMHISLKLLKNKVNCDQIKKRGDTWDYSINSDFNNNTVVWAMFEEYVATMETE